MTDDTTPPQSIPLETFDLRDGLVSSALEQSSVDAFAADFQALRHFGEKLGNALDLNAPWMGSLQEADYSLAYSTAEKTAENTSQGKGARVGQRAPLFELLSHITDSGAEA